MRFQAEGQATVLVLGGVQGENPPDLGLTARAPCAPCALRLCGSAALRLLRDAIDHKVLQVIVELVERLEDLVVHLQQTSIRASITARLRSLV